VAPPLAGGEDGKGRQGQGVQRAGLRDEGQVAEQDVANDPPVLLGHEGQEGVAAVPEGVHQAGLVLPSEGLAVDLADGLVVFGPHRGIWWTRERLSHGGRTFCLGAR
jgi:hypothetical protein